VIGAIEAIDDAVEAIPVHLAGGIWGVLAAGLFAKPDLLVTAYGSTQRHFAWIYDLSDGKLLGCQFLKVIFVASWISIIMFPLFGLRTAMDGSESTS
jgi:ammonium transporter, Amt family